MLGTFSNRKIRDHSVGLSSLGQYVFHEDGTLAVIALTECEENKPELLQEYTWSRAGDSLVVVEVPEEDIFEAWRVTPGETCDTLLVEQIQHGDPAITFPLIRGAVCMKELPPCLEGTSCETCETTWCDEAPPPCGE